MAKGDHDSAMNAINTTRNNFTTGTNALSNQFSSQYNAANTADTGLRNQITSQYSKYLDPENINNMFGDINTDTLKNFGAGSFTGDSYIPGVSGGIDDSLITGMGAIPYAEYQKMSQQGNDYINPDFMSSFNQSMGNVDLADKSYQDFMTTGGFSQADIDAMRAQSVAPTRQIYQNAQANQITAANRAGGNLGNSSVAAARMAADAADKIGTVNTNTEANLAQLKQQGKEFGTTGLAQTSLAQAQAKTAVQQLDAQLKEAGLAGMTDIEKTRLQGELTNAQINEQAGAANAQIALGKAGLTLNANQILAALDQTKANYGLTAADDLTKLYGTTPASTALAGSDQLNTQNLIQSGQLGLNQNQISASQIPGNFSQAMGNVGSVLGLVGNVAGGIAGLGGGGSKMSTLGNLAKGLLGGGGGGGSSSTPAELNSFGGTTTYSGNYNPADFEGIDPETGMPINSYNPYASPDYGVGYGYGEPNSMWGG